MNAALRLFQRQHGLCASQQFHLINGNFIQFFEPLILRQAVADEVCIDAFEVGQHEELFGRGVVAEVAFEVGILSQPFAGGAAEEGYIQQIGFLLLFAAFVILEEPVDVVTAGCFRKKSSKQPAVTTSTGSSRMTKAAKSSKKR